MVWNTMCFLARSTAIKRTAATENELGELNSINPALATEALRIKR